MLSIAFVPRIAKQAQKNNHHPDVSFIFVTCCVLSGDTLQKLCYLPLNQTPIGGGWRRSRTGTGSPSKRYSFPFTRSPPAAPAVLPCQNSPPTKPGEMCASCVSILLLKICIQQSACQIINFPGNRIKPAAFAILTRMNDKNTVAYFPAWLKGTISYPGLTHPVSAAYTIPPLLSRVCGGL